MLSQHSRSQARVKEEGCDRLGEPTLKLSHSYGDETQKILLGRNPLNDAPHQNPGVVSNGQGPGRHPPGGALHRRPDVVEKEQGSLHLTRRVRRVRMLAKPRRIRLGSWNIGSLRGKLRMLIDTAVRGVDILCVQETKWRGQKAKGVEDTGFKL